MKEEVIEAEWVAALPKRGKRRVGFKNVDRGSGSEVKVESQGPRLERGAKRWWCARRLNHVGCSCRQGEWVSVCVSSRPTAVWQCYTPEGTRAASYLRAEGSPLSAEARKCVSRPAAGAKRASEREVEGVAKWKMVMRRKLEATGPKPCVESRHCPCTVEPARKLGTVSKGAKCTGGGDSHRAPGFNVTPGRKKRGE